MSYVDEVYERVVAQNPGEPEFHQAVKEVLDSLKLVIDANEEKYRKAGILERFVEPEIGVVGIWWSVPIGWALADIVGLLYYKIRKQSLFCFTD